MQWSERGINKCLSNKARIQLLKFAQILRKDYCQQPCIEIPIHHHDLRIIKYGNIVI